MNFNVGNIYNGFKLIEIKDLNEIGSKGYIFNHEKTGAQLIKIANEDDNKVFSIGFRTPPSNDTGVPHILEHSVLCGSRKFDTKEPFVELLKGSLNTFLNAMTYPDKTIYPVASRNEKDYFNLMDVYLDAVLYPNIYKYKEIFMQEGWHYSIDDKNEPLKYNGVVYNEMKGAYSSPDSILYRSIPETIYPDTCYAYSSGGDPNNIPDLTYEEFLDFHKKYYHPSNSYIFLYGNEDLLKELEFINDNYLKDFEMKNIDSHINSQKPFKEMVEKKYNYGISENDNLDGKSYYSLNFVVGEAIDYELYLAFEVLSYLLLRSTAAPLKKALVEAGIGKAVSGDYDNCIKQPSFTVLVKNADMNLEEKFKKVTIDTLKQLIKEGIDKELIEASINRIEFELREGDYGSYPKGLVYYLKVMDSWLYGGKPFVHLEYDKALEKVKTALNERYFEELIEKYFINNPHSSLVSLHPEKGLNETKEKGLMEKLEKIKESMNDNEVEKIINNCKKLKERQNTPDTEEALKCIPALSLKDINKEAEKLPLQEKEINGIKVLHHSFNTNKISYVNFFFDTLSVKQELIPYIALLADILGKCGTKKYDYSKLSNKVNINTGGISYNPITFSSLTNEGDYKPYLEVSFKCLDSKIENTLEILYDILLNSNLNDIDRIKQIIAEKRARLEGAIFDNGHRIAFKKVLSYAYSKGAYDEIVSGLKYYEFLVDLDENFDGEKISTNLKEVKDVIFNKNNLLISFSALEDEYDNFTKYFNKFSKKLKSSTINKYKYSFELCHKNEGLLTQGNVQYVSKGGNYKQCGYDYHGALSLLETILGFDYLWNSVRVKGGAYGVFSNFRRDGGAYIVSYRDPNIKETIEVYDNTSIYIANFEANEREMTKYIIGTIRKHDQPISNSIKGDIATAHYLAGLTYEMLQKEREEIINADLVTIRSFAPLVNDLMKSDYLCVIGNENKIKENSNLFNKLYKVIK
ncbi:insulinase family protein [Clostridium tarantellae]|uniref:Insulinase family protein n=1 Tax=Clostridium tarantellae TaxID=39493 RepID=A0A6I1MT27_9CLOT|nr:insulinase family protein [Clostridium tarantellae]MPQ43389.1 insulinase family protein [Clostridium tarantellae]